MDYTLSVLRNSTEIGSVLPIIWNTSTISDGWWNISIIVTDVDSNEKARDEVLVYVENNPHIQPTIRARAFTDWSQSWLAATWDSVWFRFVEYDTAGTFDNFGDIDVRSFYIIPEDGYYFFTVTLKLVAGAGQYFEVIIFNQTGGQNPVTDNANHITEGFGSPSDSGDYTLTITDIKWLSKNMKITVWGTSPDGVFNIDGGPDESFFVIEKLPY